MDSTSEWPDSPVSPEARPTLDDPWVRRGPIPLDGRLERASLASPIVSFLWGFFALIGAFVVFQFIISPVVLLVQIALSEGGLGALKTIAESQDVLATYTRELIVSNSAGQVLGLALPALILARLHSSRVAEYLRFRSVDRRLLGLALLGIVVLQPGVQWLAQLNQQIPLPEVLRRFEQTQLELIQSVLESGLGVYFNLIMLSLIPGLCEETLFRGYAQRQFERASGPALGILFSGFLFGFYHLRLSQVIPLVFLGLYLAYLTWRTGSIWPAVLVHIVHNGIAVIAARYVQSHEAYDLQTLEQAPMPWYIVVGGFAIFAVVLYVMHYLARRVRDT